MGRPQRAPDGDGSPTWRRQPTAPWSSWPSTPTGRTAGRITRTLQSARPSYWLRRALASGRADGSVVVVLGPTARKGALSAREPSLRVARLSPDRVRQRPTGVSEIHLFSQMDAACDDCRQRACWPRPRHGLQTARGSPSSATTARVETVRPVGAHRTVTRSRTTRHGKTPAWPPGGRSIAFVGNRGGAMRCGGRGDGRGVVALIAGPAGATSLAATGLDRVLPDPGAATSGGSSLETMQHSGHPASCRFRLCDGQRRHRPLSIAAARPSLATPTMSASRGFASPGGMRTYPRVGILRYTHSPSHNHWHLMDFRATSCAARRQHSCRARTANRSSA